MPAGGREDTGATAVGARVRGGVGGARPAARVGQCCPLAQYRNSFGVALLAAASPSGAAAVRPDPAAGPVGEPLPTVDDVSSVIVPVQVFDPLTFSSAPPADCGVLELLTFRS